MVIPTLTPTGVTPKLCAICGREVLMIALSSSCMKNAPATMLAIRRVSACTEGSVTAAGGQSATRQLELARKKGRPRRAFQEQPLCDQYHHRRGLCRSGASRQRGAAERCLRTSHPSTAQCHARRPDGCCTWSPSGGATAGLKFVTLYLQPADGFDAGKSMLQRGQGNGAAAHLVRCYRP